MIRPYRDSDLDEVLEAWYSASLVGHPFLDGAFFDAERINIRDVYMPNAETWVFEQDGVVVGFVALIGNEVGGLFVAASHHEKGIGRALMDHARTLRDDLELLVFKDNDVGTRFYERYGFRRVGEEIHEGTGLVELRLRLEAGR